MSSVKELSDFQLRNELIGLGFKAGPVTATTRKLYEKKLETLRNGHAQNGKPTQNVTPAKSVPVVTPAKSTPAVAAAKSTPNVTSGKSTVPTKNANIGLQTAQSQSANSPAFAKKVSNKPQVVESSDEELDLTVASTVESPARPAAMLITKRIEQTREPSPKLHVDEPEEEEEDDHMETSRTVPPFNPYGPRYSFGANRSNVSSSSAASDSPIDKLRRISKGTWSYFSRSSPAPTPYSEISKNSFKIGSSTRHRYGPNSSMTSTRSVKTSDSGERNVSGWLLIILSVILVAYLWTVNQEVVHANAVAAFDSAKQLFNFFYSYLILPAIAVLLLLAFAVGGYQLNKYRDAKRKERQVRLMELVDRITALIRNNGNVGIPELHARDILLPPTKRTNDDWALWKEAAAFINLEDSRVRTEVRLINGDECNVWMWVPTTTRKW